MTRAMAHTESWLLSLDSTLSWEGENGATCRLIRDTSVAGKRRERGAGEQGREDTDGEIYLGVTQSI